MMPSEPANDESIERTISLNYDVVRQVGVIGVQRSYVFMGIGVNASLHNPPISHVINEAQRISFTPDEVSSEIASHYIQEFQEWIICNALRDLLETLSLFLTELHTANKIALQIVNIDDATTAYRDFDHAPLSEKLRISAALIDYPIDQWMPIFNSWRRARNCLAHRLGVVRAEDCDRGSSVLTVRWMGMFLEGVEPDGNVVPIDLSNGGHPFPRGARIHIRTDLKNCAFPLGSQLRMNRSDLSELCLTANIFIEQIMQASMSKLQSNGVQFGQPASR